MPPAYEVLLLNTAIPQIQAAQSGDTYVVPRDIQITANLDVTGNTTLGDASTDTVRVNGYMGVGGAPGASTAITVAPTALTGTLQYGVSSQPTGTSAATNSIIAFDAFAQVANAVFTVNNVYGLSVRAGSKGASATATNWHGIQIADQTQGTNNYGVTSLVSSGANKWNIYASGTAANYFAGNLAIGSTTQHEVVSLSNTSGARISFEDQGTRRYTIGNSGTSFTLTDATASADRLTFATDAAVFNDPGSDYDFRVESDTNTHAFFVQGSDGFVGIGTNSPSAKVQIAGVEAADYTTALTTNSLLSNAAPSSFLYVQNDNDLDGTFCGISFNTTRTGGSGNTAYIANIASSSNNAGILAFGTRSGSNTLAERLRIDASGNVGIGTSAPNASAILDAQSTTKGVRMPNMTTTQKNAIASPAAGLIVFDTTLAKLCVYSGAAWETITSV